MVVNYVDLFQKVSIFRNQVCVVNVEGILHELLVSNIDIRLNCDKVQPIVLIVEAKLLSYIFNPMEILVDNLIRNLHYKHEKEIINH